MKKYIIIAFLIGILIGFTVGYGYLLGIIPYSPSEYSEEMKVGAYYYIWWGIPFNNHWKEAIKGMPFLGGYNSSNPTVANKHILLAKQHGIDFFAVSWIGEGKWTDWDFDDIDRNLQNGLLNASHIQNFNFCLFYETQIVLDASNREHMNFTEIFLNDMIYAAQHYFNHSSYLRVDGKPVLFIYNLPYLYLYSPIPAQELLNQTRQQLASIGSDVYFIGDVGGGPLPSSVNSTWLYSMNSATSYFFSNPSKGWNEILKDARTYYPEWRRVMNSQGIKFIPNVYSGFNNTGLNGVVEPVALPNNATMFKEMLKIAINNADSDLKMVMITSWNEWLESTAIEPSMEFGELFLHTIYDVVRVSIKHVSLAIHDSCYACCYLYKEKTAKIKKRYK